LEKVIHNAHGWHENCVRKSLTIRARRGIAAVVVSR